MKTLYACACLLFTVASVAAQATTNEVVRTNTFQIVGSQMQAGKWQKRIASLPEGANITITAAPKETLLQNTKVSELPGMSLRFRPSDRECRCDARGRWTSEDYKVFREAELSVTVPKDAALYTTSTANARFQLTVITRQTVISPNKASAGSK